MFILKTIFVQWGERLVANFSSVLYIYILIACIMLLYYLIVKYFFKLKMEASVSFGIVLFLLSIFMILVPYYKGERLFELKEFGNKLVISIENYQIENNELPAKIDSLYPKFITLEELELSKSIVKYNLFRRNISGSNLTDNEEQQHEDFFSLTIYEDFMGFYYLSYQRKERKFIFTEG